MRDTKEKQNKRNTQDEELQIALMKIVAEQNHEMFLEYEKSTDIMVFSEVKNGQFVVRERITDCMRCPEKIYSRVAEEDKKRYQEEIMRCMSRPHSRIFDIRYCDNKNEKKWHRVFLVSQGNEENTVERLAARIVSIHKEKVATELLRTEAERDSLGGLYNHKTYESMAKDMIRRHYDSLLFIMIDIDHFKHINDRHGHYVGDKVIRSVSNILNLAVQGKGIAGRLGGDEFSVCIRKVQGREEAKDFCIRIKEAIKQSVDDVEFGISMGVLLGDGSKLSYEQAYYAADKALFYAKEHGRNQIIFEDEIAKQNEDVKQSIQQDEESELDQLIEYRVVADAANKQILYINEAARKKLGVSLEEAQSMCCYQLLKGSCKECDVCELRTNHVQYLTENENMGLRKYVPNGKFLLQSHWCNWKGQVARMIKLLDLNDARHVTEVFEKDDESQSAIDKCWDMILRTTTQEVEYAEILKVMAEYYDSDCCAIVTKEAGNYKDLYEYHKPACKGVAEGLRVSIGEGVLNKMEVLLSDDGCMRRRHIEQVLKEYPDLSAILEEKFVVTTLGMRLARNGAIVGVLLVINPKHHAEDYGIVKKLGAYFTTDLVRKQLSDTKRYEETHDMLTRLWSRGFFSEWIGKYGKYFEKNFGVYTVDILHLGEINREFGYDKGNEVIIEVADALKHVFAGYSIFRYDDDQILAICHDVNKNSFQKLLDYVKEQLEETHVEIAIGYYWTADGDLMDVLRIAENYLQKDKERLARGNDADGKMIKRVEDGVQEQIDLGNFHVYLQPKVSILQAQTVGAEALIRLFDDVHGMISPAFFIPLLEQKGVIYMIDLFVLEEVFRFQRKALDEGKRVVPISVNFSKNTLIYKQLMERITQMKESYPIPDGLIQIEITETISTMDHITVTNIANALRNIGFSISMDDFGTKYSNMAVLTQFEFDAVKIDRSLLLDIEKNAKNETILRHTLSMMEELQIDAVMEGVETQEQIDCLKKLGGDIVQGFFYGRPEPHEKFYELFMENK